MIRSVLNTPCISTVLSFALVPALALALAFAHCGASRILGHWRGLWRRNNSQLWLIQSSGGRLRPRAWEPGGGADGGGTKFGNPGIGGGVGTSRGAAVVRAVCAACARAQGLLRAAVAAASVAAAVSVPSSEEAQQAQADQ